MVDNMINNMSIVESLFEGDLFLTSLCIITIFLACPAFLMKVIPRTPILNKVTFVPFLFFVPMILSSMGVIPSSYPLYKPLQSIVLYMAIFFMVLAIDLRQILRSLQTRILILFLLGCVGTALGAILAHVVLTPVISAKQSAMATACTCAAYSGGSMNWVAVSEALEVPESLTATAFPAMVVIYTLYLAILLTLENSPLKPILERWTGTKYGADRPTAYATDRSRHEHAEAPKLEDYINGFLAFCIVYMASMLLEQLVRGFFFVPLVIFLTTFAIVLGTATPLKKLRGMSTFGEASLYFLLCIIGAQAPFTSSLVNSPVLLLIPVVVIAVHVLVLLLSARLLRVDLVTSAIVSIAAIGGAASAPVTAAALQAKELIPLGVILGSLGYAVGTYLGVYLGILLLP